MKTVPRIAACALVLVLVAANAPAAAPQLPQLLDTLKKVGTEGAHNPAAAQAWRDLAQQGADALLPILAAFDDGKAVSDNWLRPAVDAIVERELQANRPLPAEKLEAFLKQTSNPGGGRKLAYELLVKVDPKAPDRLLPGLLNDPHGELRRDAVAASLVAADRLAESDKDAAAASYAKLLRSARDVDQVIAIVNGLKKLGVAIDVAGQLGFVRHWALVGPFDNTDRTGFPVAYPPEKGVDLAVTYDGKKGAKVAWVAHTTPDSEGKVDLNKVLGKHKGSVAYALAVVESPDERPVEVRAGCVNAIKIFLNGKEIFARDAYHQGMEIDQHLATGTLRKGRNELLLKVVQNEQTEPWAQFWWFQARLCDHLGTPLPVKVEELKVGANPAAEGKVQP
jgi:hypothetical protein